jgi:hypothetical protein
MIDTMDPTVQRPEWLVYRVRTGSLQPVYSEFTASLHESDTNQTLRYVNIKTPLPYVIMARKSQHLCKGVLLEGWHCQTARLTAITVWWSFFNNKSNVHNIFRAMSDGVNTP